MRENIQQVIMKDTFDSDIFHVGYRFPMGPMFRGKYHQRTALTIHVDDLEDVFGEDVASMAKGLAPGEFDFIWIKAETAEN